MLTGLAAQSVAEKQRKMVEGCRPRIKWSQGALQVSNLFKSFHLFKSVSTKPKGVIYTQCHPQTMPFRKLCFIKCPSIQVVVKKNRGHTIFSTIPSQYYCLMKINPAPPGSRSRRQYRQPRRQKDSQVVLRGEANFLPTSLTEARGF